MKIIKNYNKLAVTSMRKDVLNIIETGLQKADPHHLMTAAVKYNKDFNSVTVHNKTFDLLSSRIFVIGGGKACGHMAEELEAIVGADNITAGVVNCKSKEYLTKKIKIYPAGHPLPDKIGVKGTRKMLELKAKYQISKKDLVICLVSGGGSALLPSPAPSVKLKDKQKVTELLIESGASISEINSVRKHLSRIKGGRLAKYFYPTPVLSLIISDVVGNKLETIASGITAPDHTTFNDAISVLHKYNITSRMPQAILDFLARGANGDEEESPKELTNAFNYFIGDKAYVLEAMSLDAKRLGYKPLIVSTELIGRPDFASEACVEEVFAKGNKKYNAFFFGGELTPSLPAGHGRGGRNQHFAALILRNMEKLASHKQWIVASFASDGIDYLENVCGALASSESLVASRGKKIDVARYINNYDTYNLFRKIGNSLIKTGDTGTNVGDLMVFLIKR